MIIDAPKSTQFLELRNLWKSAFGDTEQFLDSFAQTAFSPNRCRCVTVDGQVVAALYWFDCTCRGRRVAYLYAIATAEAYRGRGLCRLLMEDTHRHLRELGYAGALLVPGGKELFAFYEKMGYRTCGYIREIHCEASSESVPVKRLGIDQYAALRRQFLPEGGVVQENENLRFLQRQAELYGGEGFLLAARAEGDLLFGTEFLGDVSVASAVVRTLGFAEGRFRTAGGDVPFAMGIFWDRPGDEGECYLGLAFD